MNDKEEGKTSTKSEDDNVITWRFSKIFFIGFSEKIAKNCSN